MKTNISLQEATAKYVGRFFIQVKGYHKGERFECTAIHEERGRLYYSCLWDSGAYTFEPIESDLFVMVGDESAPSEEIENVSECTTVRRHATADRVAEICKTIANAVSVCYGSSFPVTDMATDLDRFGAWCAGEDEGDIMKAAFSFWFAVRKQGSESGTRKYVKERCKHFGAPVYVIKVEREEYTALYTVTVRVSSPATGEKVADSYEDQREALSEVCRVSAVLASVKAQAKETARKVKKAAVRVSLVVFRVLWAVSILAATLGVMYLCASFLGDVVPASTPFVCRLLLFVVAVFLPSFGVEWVLLKGSKAIDIATNRRLLAMS